MSIAPDTITVRVALAVRHRRGGRKALVTPPSSPIDRVGAITEQPPLGVALARAFRWRKLMETGIHSTIQELAAAEKVDASYVGRVLRLTLLTPDLIEGFLGGSAAAGITLRRVLSRFPVEWPAQRRMFLSD